MADDDLWTFYEKDRLPRGWSYPLGRDRIAGALREAGATVNRLRLVGPGRSSQDDDRTAVLRLLWVGDGQARYHGGNFTGASRLHMDVDAVPGHRRRDIAEQLEAGIVQRACRWAAEALTRGNVWAATTHEFVVAYEEGRLHVTET